VNEEKRLRKILRRGILADLFRSRTSAPVAPQTDTGARDTIIHSLVSRTLGPSVANALISAMVHGIYAADSRMLSVRSTFPILWDAMFSGNKKTGSLVWNLVSSGLFGKRIQKTAEEERKAVEEAAAWASLGPLDAERKKWSVYGLKSGLGVLTDKMEHEARMGGVTFVRECEVGDVRVDEQGKVKVSIQKYLLVYR
jgi:oxygen-dependent protoporphyrinogen oxidase